jgi:hypothetical protein
MTAKRRPVTYPERKPLVLDEPLPAEPMAEPVPAAQEPTPATVAPSRAGKRAVTFYLPQEKWLALRTLSLRSGRPTHELMAEAADWLLRREV